MIRSNFRHTVCFTLLLQLVGCGEGDKDNSADKTGASTDENSEAIEFLNLRAEEIDNDRAIIRFETSVETTCEVQYGTKENALDLIAVDPDMDPENPFAILHRVPLEDLPPNTLIYYRAKGTTPEGETALSKVATFNTLPANTESSPLDGMQNIALLSAGATVSDVSSNFGDAANDSSWGANSAVDGQMATEWATAGQGDDAWIEIDLSTPKTLSGFSFRSREMSDGTSIIQSVSLVLDDNTHLGPFLTPDPSVNYEFRFDNEVNSQTVRLEAQSTSGGNTGAKEIGLFVTKTND